MLKNVLSLILLLIFVSSVQIAGESSFLRHDLKVTLDPGKSFIKVIDTIYIPVTTMKIENKIHFLLHGNLTIVSIPNDIEIKKDPGEIKSEFFGINTSEFEIKKKIPINHYSIRFLNESSPTETGKTITIGYEGKINHPIEQIGAEYARGFSETPGIICEEGAYLAGASFWVPWFNDELVSFKLETTAPEKWEVVSQGKRIAHETKNGTRISTWDSPEPMDEVYLVAAKFKEYGVTVGNVDVMAFLREPDDNLANKYLETTGQYLEMYEKLIGPYPYSKFALIENFWETGYGMPSFTLLGSKVIRFPFILHSSYPHELLHNWWGNSVFVDYNSGNWCEGLTTYLADHLIKEQRGEGEEYRKTTLQDYTHYAADKKEEFPLTRFKARYDSLSSSIGYGKSLFIYHMLRRQVGDSQFEKIIKHFYKENKFKSASFEDFRKSVEAVTQINFKEFFTQWVTRTGAPEILLSKALPVQKGNNYVLRFTLEQTQKQQPNILYTLSVPVAVSLEGQKEAVVKTVELSQKKQDFEFTFDKRPVFIDVDPQFDVFRKLHNDEIPATLSNAFGSKNVLILLPSKAPADFLKGYKELAEDWAKDGEGKIEIKMDNDVSSLPSDKPVWLFGWENFFNSQKFLEGVAPLAVQEPFFKKVLGNNKSSVVTSVKNKNNPEHVVVLLFSDRTAALPGLGRKLPHYGKYSYLAFEGDEPVNTLKGQWPLTESPMSASFSKSAAHGILPQREPLERLAPLFSSKRMMEHVKYLASDELEGRGLGTQGIEKAAQYIADTFKNAGSKPAGDSGSYFQTWEIIGGPENKPMTLRNVIGVIPGSNPEYAGQSIILCAHYDHLGRGWPVVNTGNEGKIHPGADDNASGVSVMLELAYTLGTSLKPGRSIVFIAFTGEESKLLGSTYYIKNLENTDKNRLKNIMAAVNLDTVGRLTGQNKLMVIGESSAKEWKFIFMGIGYTTGIQTELIQQDLDASDHVDFIKAGIPGIQLFSGPHMDYHRPSDTADKIDVPGLVKVATVAKEIIVYLSERKEPLTFISKEGISSPSKPEAPTDVRRVGTGLMPDFSYSGKGVMIGMVSPGSTAEKAGLKKGDIIIKLGNIDISNLKEYSEALKTFKPGDIVTFVYKREDKEYSTPVTLTAR